MLRSRFVYNKIMQSSSSASQAPHDFNSAADHDSATVAYLLAKRRTAGGYNWSYADVKAAQALISRGIQLPFAGFLHPDVPLPPRSAFNMASEDYVKRCILEMFGVLCQIKHVTYDKRNKIMWLMSGVCPFHRHVHDSQHWAIVDGNEETQILCFFPLESGRLPRAIVPHLPLVAPGDGPNYPVAIRQPRLE